MTRSRSQCAARIGKDRAVPDQRYAACGLAASKGHTRLLSKSHRREQIEAAFHPVDISLVRAALFDLLADGRGSHRKRISHRSNL